MVRLADDDRDRESPLLKVYGTNQRGKRGRRPFEQVGMAPNHALRDTLEVRAARERGGSEQTQQRVAGRVRRRAVVVGAGPIDERLTVFGREEKVALRLIVEALCNVCREAQRGAQKTLPRTGAVEVEAGLEHGGEIVQEGGHLAASFREHP